MADSPNETPQAPVELTGMLRSVSYKMEKATRPIIEWQEWMAQTIEKALDHSDTQRILDLLEDAVKWISDVVQASQEAIPSNLHGVEDIREVAALTRDEGLPLVWVPRQDILQLLVKAADAGARCEILMAHRNEILEDCVTALDDCAPLLAGCVSTLPPMCHEWVKESDDAACALKAGFCGPAQSHAANVIDGIVPYMSWFLADKPRRDDTLDRAEEDVGGVESLALLMNHLALRPLVLAYEKWYPSTNQPPPSQFARHVTVHGVGHPRVFSEYNALIAVMLATSLTRQLCYEVARYLHSTGAAA